ncbi:MAG: fibronectin type III domain-containing protein [Bacteroidetes bacterium]|nr:fibronectin type III domain-containing protein [Bacteroidota bacterium]
MKKHSLKVALNMSRTSVPDKINKARLITDAINNNPATFASPIPAIATVVTAINDLEIAWNNAVDGGKSKKAIMHDKESELLKLMNDLGHYVEGVADGDESKVHLAAMDSKKLPHIKNLSEFEVAATDDRGAVNLKVKAKIKTVYKWQYCMAPTNQNAWVTASSSTVSRATIGNLVSGALYYFRVLFINTSGDSQTSEIAFVVN